MRREEPFRLGSNMSADWFHLSNKEKKMLKFKHVVPMFLYLIVTGNPTKDSETSVKIPYELRNDDNSVIQKGSVSLQFLRSDATDEKGATLSVDERVSNIKQQFYDWGYSYLKRAESGDSDFNKLITQLNGLRVP